MVNNSSLEKPRIVFISSYPPRHCGIATFTQDLRRSLAGLYPKHKASKDYLQVIAIDHKNSRHQYTRETIFVLDEENLDKYAEAADLINNSNLDVVSLQHEFGLFGGKKGRYVTELTGKIQKPLVSTLHTVPEKPTPLEKEILREICGHSNKIIVIAQKAYQFLGEIYGVPEDRISLIHHGVHPKPFQDPDLYKDIIGMEGRPVILNFGLLDEQKGIEYVIEAMEEVTRHFPGAAFIVVGCYC